ncbi:MAG: hypothetical protein K6G38_05465 [Gammaproteobacteria bacterium]|nr:hypothetical protein [Gammaproteobacteria bacterium]
MDNFIYSALLYEIYKEVLFITYHYQEERITFNMIKEEDYLLLARSKNLYAFARKIELNEELREKIDPDFYTIIASRVYDKEKVRYLIDYLNEYTDIYLDYMHKLIDKISNVANVKMIDMGLRGEYPLYMKIEETKLTIRRVVLNTNASLYFDKKTSKFGFRVTYVDYDVPLKDYSYNGINLKEKTKKEIIDIMDSSINVNLSHSNFYDTSYLQYKDDVNDYSDGEISMFLEKFAKQDGVKEAMKVSFRNALIGLAFFLLIMGIFFIYKYFIKG